MVQAPLPPSDLPGRSLTLAEFLELPETKPASEYINGQILQKPMAQGEHSVVQRELTQFLDAMLKPQQIARAFPELRCVFGGRAQVPDISVFRWAYIPRQPNGRIANRFERSPDWTIEILSPGQSQTKVMRNILHCLRHGAEMGWLIDSEESGIFVYRPNQLPEFFEESSAILPVPEFAGAVALSVEQLFGWLLE